MKVLRAIIKLIIIGAFGFLVGFVSYKISNKLVGNVDIKITFDDSKTFTLENVNKISKEEALKNWPYIFKLENTSSREADYQLIISDVSGNIKRNSLSYVLVRDDQELDSGKLDTIKDNILYQGHVDGKQVQNYKLYVYVNKTLDEKIEELSYEYKIELKFK